MKKFNWESGWKAPFCPNQMEEGETLEDLYVGIIYKAGSTLNIFKCLYYSLIYSRLSYCTVSWGRTYLTKLNCLQLLPAEKSTKDYNTIRLARS